MNVSYAAAARVEFLGAVAFYEEQSQGLGRAFAREVREAVQAIVENPTAWSKLTKTTRRYRLNKFRYGIVYRIHKREVRIVAVMHLHRRPGYWKGRK